MGSGFAKKKKEARLIQQQFQDLQGKLKEESAVGSAGNGLVTITLNGEHHMTAIKIKPECVDPEDIQGLEDLIQAAHKEAVSKIADHNAFVMRGMRGMMND